MFGNFFKDQKNKLMQKLVEKQMAKLPPEQRELITALIEHNPDLFEKIGKEIQTSVKSGKNQQYAMMNVMSKYKKEIKKAVEGYQTTKSSK